MAAKSQEAPENDPAGMPRKASGPILFYSISLSCYVFLCLLHLSFLWASSPFKAYPKITDHKRRHPVFICLFWPSGHVPWSWMLCPRSMLHGFCNDTLALIACGDCPKRRLRQEPTQKRENISRIIQAILTFPPCISMHQHAPHVTMHMLSLAKV